MLDHSAIMFSRQLLTNIARFASGEALARVASIAVMMLLGHKYGVAIVGAYALALSVSGYGITIIDFGLKHIGSRLIARYPEHGGEIVRRVQRRRFLMAGVAVPLIVIYSLSIKFPPSFMLFVVLFSLATTLYAASLDWAAWGTEHLQLIGGLRALVPISILVAVLIGRAKNETVLWWAAVGNLIGYLLQAAVFREWWRRQGPHSWEIANPDALEVISSSLVWRSTVVMGSAWIAQIAFNSIDTLMLGVMSGPEQVGLYSSAYRILSQVLIAYYVIILPLYPKLARVAPEQRMFFTRPSILLSLFGVGTGLAIVVGLLRKGLLILVFGRSFLPAAILLSVLVWAIPLDFVTSYLNNAYIAWGMERKLLSCIAAGAATNIVLNLILLPRYGATGAAVNTIIAYIVYLVGLALMRPYVRAASQAAAYAMSN